MEITKNTGKKLEKWIIYHEGLCYYETYGPSMTDWATVYKLDDLLGMKEKDRIKTFEQSLPEEIGSLKKVLLIVIDEIKIAVQQNPKDDSIAEINKKIPEIKAYIKELAS